MDDNRRILPDFLHRTYTQIINDTEHLDVSVVNTLLPGISPEYTMKQRSSSS
jgi:hypothetical protein